jgi:integrase
MARVGSTPPKGLWPDEVAALLVVLAADVTVTGRRDRALFEIPTGSRLGLALALDVADLDHGARTATLRELKGGGTMQVYLRPELVELLAAAVGTGGRRQRG